jgi:hypothetical protein
VKGFILAAIPDVLIAIVVANITEIGVPAFFFTLIGLQIIYFVLWLKRFIFSWLYFWLFSRKSMTAVMLDYLKEQRYPRPKLGLDYDDYLSGVVADKALPMKLKLDAAALAAQLSMTKTIGKMSTFLQMAMALDDALTNYRREFKIQPPEVDEEEDNDGGDEPELSNALLAEFKRDHPSYQTGESSRTRGPHGNNLLTPNAPRRPRSS